DQCRVDHDVDERGENAPLPDEAAQPVAVLGERREGQVAIAARHHEDDPRSDEEAERQQPAGGYKSLRRGVVSHRVRCAAKADADASPSLRAGWSPSCEVDETFSWNSG